MKKVHPRYAARNSHPLLDLLSASLSAMGLFMAAAYLITFYG